MAPIPVKILREGAILPTYGSAEAAGADLYACLDAPVTIAPGQTSFIPTGIAMAVPQGGTGTPPPGTGRYPGRPDRHAPGAGCLGNGAAQLV